MQSEDGMSSDMYMQETETKHKKNKSKKQEVDKDKTMALSDSEVHTDSKIKDEKTEMAVANKVTSLKDDASNPDNYSLKSQKETSLPSLLNQ